MAGGAEDCAKRGSANNITTKTRTEVLHRNEKVFGALPIVPFATLILS
jgi:hypothetical protein